MELAAPWRRKEGRKEEEDAEEEEEELIFPLWEKHMLDLQSWRESSHLALIGTVRGGGAAAVGGGEDERHREMLRLLLMIYCLKRERRFGFERLPSSSPSGTARPRIGPFASSRTVGWGGQEVEPRKSNFTHRSFKRKHSLYHRLTGSIASVLER